MSNARDKANIPSLNFSSTGIDDNATSTAITIDSSENVGIGTAFPNNYASSGNTLVVGSTSGQNGITIVTSTSETGSLQFADGATGNQSYQGRIRYDHSASTMSFHVNNGSERMRIDSSGNVGIGTSSPSAVLDVRDETNGANFIVGGSGTTNITKIGGGAGDNLQLFTNSSTAVMMLSTSGNVGINNSAPSTELEVYGTIKAHEKSGLAQASILIDALATGNPHLAFQQAGAYKGYIHYLDASDTICLNDGSGNGLHYSPSQQKLGIGTSSPSSYYANHLVVDIGSTAQSGITIVADSSNQAMLAFADGTSGDTRYRGYLDYNHSNDSLAFASAGTERMRIDSSGNVGIGITSLQVPFEVNQTTTEFSHFGSNSVSILNRFTGISLGYAELGNTNYRKIKIAAVGLGDGSARQDLKFLVRTAGDGNSAGLGDSKLSISGTTGIVSGDLNDTSDIGFKENITNITDSLTLVKQLKPRFFTWKDAKAERGNSTGFIAQEVEEIIPLLVQGNDLGSTITGDDGSQSQDMSGKSINTIGLVAHLTKALQEQQTKIEELETRITTLEANNP